MLRRGACLVFFLITAVLLYLQVRPSEAFTRVEMEARDYVSRAARKAAANPRLVFLGIDAASMNLDPDVDFEQFFKGERDRPQEAEEALTLMSGGWPWSRKVHALVIERLLSAGAQAVVLDLTFPKATANDASLREVLERHRDRVVLASNFVESDLGNGGASVVRLSLPTDSLIPECTPTDERLGFDNFWPDGVDEVIRSAQFRSTLELANRYTLAESVSESDSFLSIAAQTVRKTGHEALIPKELKSYPIRFAGPAGTFPARSIYEIFVPRYWKQNYADGEFFRGKIVVVGAIGNWQQDDHLTPFGIMPGAEIHLNAMNALLHGELLTPVSERDGLLLTLGTAATAWVLWRVVKGWGMRIVGLVVLLGVWIALVIVCFNRGLILPLVPPVLALGLNGSSGLIVDLLRVQKERRRIRSTLERYVSRNVVKELVDDPHDYHEALGGTNKAVTVLFSDIRNFTRVCANTAPQRLVAQLNEYLGAMVTCVFEHGGTLDKFIGDAVMAVWGNACSHGSVADAKNAVRCALAMREALARLNEKWRTEGKVPFEIGIALNHGEVVVGNIGSPHRMEFTVIGDAVNICWRLQERTKAHTGELIVGEGLGQLIAPEFSTEPLGSILVGQTIWARYSRLVSAAEKAGRTGALKHAVATAVS